MAETALTIEAAGWTERAAHVLLSALDAASDLADLKSQVEHNQASLFEVSAAGAFVGAYVLRVDQLVSGAEGVLVAAAGHLNGVALLPLLLPQIESQFHGVARYRIHTSRPGIAKLAEKAGYTASEIVLRKPVPHA